MTTIGSAADRALDARTKGRKGSARPGFHLVLIVTRGRLNGLPSARSVSVRCTCSAKANHGAQTKRVEGADLSRGDRVVYDDRGANVVGEIASVGPIDKYPNLAAIGFTNGSEIIVPMSAGRSDAMVEVVR